MAADFELRPPDSIWYNRPMPVGLDALGVTFLARELRGLLSGRRIDTVLLGDDRVLRITFARARAHLAFLHEPAFALLCMMEERAPSGDIHHVTRFENKLKGLRVADVGQIDLDRIVMITLNAGTETLRLYLELMPPFPNMLLTDRDDTIIEPLFRAGMHTRKRVLERGEPYSPPDAGRKLHPADVSNEDLKDFPWREDEEILSKRILGTGPFLSREIVWRARQSGTLRESLEEILQAYRNADVKPHMFQLPGDISKMPPFTGVTWFEPRMDRVSHTHRVESLNMASAKLLREFLAVSGLERRRAAMMRALSRQLKRWEKAKQKTGEAKAEAEKVAQYRRYGELIVANLARIGRGASEIRLPDLYSEDQGEVSIPLEPRLTPQANAEVYFKRARKAERRRELVAERMKQAEARVQELRRLLGEVHSEGIDDDRLRKIESELAGAKTAAKPREELADPRAERLGIRPRRYVVAGGWAVLVGRSARENDILTHRYASPGDLWFHARQAHGSHVVLKRDKKKTQVPKEAIVEAAAIAAYHSKARTSKHVPVSYTEKRYVKRIRKGPPGLAAMLREKVIFVEPTLPR